MRGEALAVNHALENFMTKRKTPRMTQDQKTRAQHGAERRNNGERRADDRRAHARFSPADARTDRRQGDRRGPRT